MSDDRSEADLACLLHQGEEGLATVFSHHSERLERMIRFRLDQRLRGRVDPGDVLQEAYLVIARRLADYLANPAVPIFIWLRSMSLQVLVDVHRRHLDAQLRNARLEVPLRDDQSELNSSLSLAACLAADMTSPSQAAVREELLHQLRQAFDSMDAIDREVLALRHFEELSNNEVAAILGLQKSAASNRYVRTLTRLKTLLASMPAFRDGPPGSPGAGFRP